MITTGQWRSAPQIRPAPHFVESRSISDALFTGGKGVSYFNVLLCFTFTIKLTFFLFVLTPSIKLRHVTECFALIG